MPHLGPPLDVPPIDLSTILRRGLKVNPDAPALTSGAGTWSWRQLDEVSSRLASGLLWLGLKPGDRVASLMPNRRELTAFYIACFKAGLVATPLNYRYQAPEIDHALEVSGASALLLHVEREADLAASKLAGKLPRGIVRYSGGAKATPGPTFDDLIDPAKPLRALPAVDPDAPAMIFFTSGSTGKPKGVTHTSRNFGAMLASIHVGMKVTPDDVWLPASSHSHIGGMCFTMASLSAGARVLIPRTIDGDELLPLFRNQRPTILWMIPAALFTLVRDHGARQEDFQSLRLCHSGGDKLPGELEKEFIELTKLEIREGYGMTEIGCATNNPVSGPQKIGSVGVVFPGYAISLRDENGVEVPRGKGGKLWVKSPCITVGYWNNPSATAETIQDGWLDTGDLMRLDDDGYLWFEGRKKQIIVHDGSNICPQEVEEALVAHPAVAEAGVVGVHDLVHGEIVMAYVTFKPGATAPTATELIQFARTTVGYKAPEIIEVLKEMPLNATGKVDRVTLKRLAEARFAH